MNHKPIGRRPNANIFIDMHHSDKDYIAGFLIQSFLGNPYGATIILEQKIAKYLYLRHQTEGMEYKYRYYGRTADMYIRENGSHGDRFAIEFKSDHFLWKSSSSKLISTRDKLNMAIENLRYPKCDHPITYFAVSQEMENIIVSICRAIVQEGPRKGKTCSFPPDKESGYCGRHTRNKEYDEGISSGKNWCRFFFRGCNNTCMDNKKSCEACLEKQYIDKSLCKHTGCKHHVSSIVRYCKKHERDIYRDEEKTKGIRYCDIARGCMNICKEGRATCDACLELNRQYDNSLYNQRKQIHNTIQHSASSETQICCLCGKDYPTFITEHHKPSMICLSCNVKQAIQDEKRKDRIRNYKNENLRNHSKHFREYFKSAMKRNLVFLLTSEEFQKIVIQPCHYCGVYIDMEAMGIDRIDNTLGYIYENCAPCCEICNKMKFTYHKDFFIEKCKYISEGSFPTEFFIKWKEYYSIRPVKYSQYRNNAKKRNIAFTLSKEEWGSLLKQACYICGFEGNIGIDRVDSKKDYSIDNCKPCCSSCNQMKWDYLLSDIVQKATMITIKRIPPSLRYGAVDKDTSLSSIQ